MKTLKYIIPVLAIQILTSCGSDNESKNQAVEQKENSNLIVLSSKQFELGEMKTGGFTKQAFHSLVKANGILDVPPENKSTVSAYFGGYVKNISLLQGQKIIKGQTLFTLESPDYIQVQQDFLEAKSQLNYLKSDYERQKDLAASNVSSQKTFLKAESDYKVTLARYESLKKKLQLMNINTNSITDQNLTSTIAVKAPISGYITSVLASKGMFLNPSDIALTIMNTDHMHIELNIFEQDLANVALGQELTFTVQNGDTPYKASVYLINKAIDPNNRTIKVHCHFKQEKDARSLTPGMFVEAELYTSSDSTLALPMNAVVTIDKKSFVLLKKSVSSDSFTFEKVEVKIGQTDHGFVSILNANLFQENSEFLTNGAFNLIKE